MFAVSLSLVICIGYSLESAGDGRRSVVRERILEDYRTLPRESPRINRMDDDYETDDKGWKCAICFKEKWQTSDYIIFGSFGSLVVVGLIVWILYLRKNR